MTQRWRWLLLALAAVTVCCLVPGSLVSENLATPRAASIEAQVPTPSGSECAAVACNAGSSTSGMPSPPLVLASTLAAGILIVLAARAIRRGPRATLHLPAGAPLRLLRPPQPALSA